MLGSCKFVDTVKHIGPHQGINQGASTERCSQGVS